MLPRINHRASRQSPDRQCRPGKFIDADVGSLNAIYHIATSDSVSCGSRVEIFFYLFELCSNCEQQRTAFGILDIGYDPFSSCAVKNEAISPGVRLPALALLQMRFNDHASTLEPSLADGKMGDAFPNITEHVALRTPWRFDGIGRIDRMLLLPSIAL
jgi:hypothetical protein